MTILIGFILVILGTIWFLSTGCVLGRQKLNLTPRENPERIAVLIAARDESAVIEDLLESLERQTIMTTSAASTKSAPSPLSMRDVFVIVESDQDPTVKICQKHGASVIIRTRPERQRKGYALDEALKQILPQHKSYDAYFIFDADNRLAPDYFEKIFASYRAGYQLATGYRSSKNANENVIAAVSTLTFSMINTIGNQKRTRRGGNIIFSGTGFYVDGRLVEEWRGWPFHSLTEDYELSLYATLHGFTTTYNTSAVFYDEQPTRFRQTIAQRTRWIKGYFSARQKYIPLMRQALRRKPSSRPAPSRTAAPAASLHPNALDVSTYPANPGSLRREAIGVKPVIMILVGVVIMFLGGLIELCARGQAGIALLTTLATLALVYFVLMFITIELIKRERLRLDPALRLRTILFNPIYLITYVYCALKALLVKNVKWTRIEHGE